MTPRQFIEELLPIIEADNNNIALEPMIEFVISSMTTPTGMAPSAVLVPAPAAVPRNTALLVHSQVLLTSHLTGLKHSGGGGGVNMAPLIAPLLQVKPKRPIEPTTTVSNAKPRKPRQ